MKYTYNKLVRDKIADNINMANNKSCTWKVLDDAEYLKQLDKKLIEEANEFIQEHSVEELGDLMEVILTIMKNNHIIMEDVEKVRIHKKKEKGGFDKKIYLIDVEEK